MKIFSTLSAKKEEFVPSSNEVTMYVCGVTPYSDAHIGHAMSYIIFDVIRRYIKFSGYKLKFIQNFTDIDDKIIDRANKRGIPASELAQQYSDSFLDDMDALNVVRADFYPKATGEIDKIIEVVKGLIDKGYAYEADGSVYFRVTKVSDYGKLAHRTLDSMMAGARIEIEQDKEHPMDFTLWKASKPGEPSWTSPWGKGRPGWHIECSAMSLKYLGETIDIHGGGQDLIFPHHENEIVQSESFTEKKPFAKYWMHNGLLQFGKDKMSKSLGNMITIKDILKKYRNADVIRVFILSSHYRSPLTYSEEALDAAEEGTDRLFRVANRKHPPVSNNQTLDATPYRNQFIEAMDDDFNTPQALAALFDLARAINQAADSGKDFSEAQTVLLELAQNVLGLELKIFKASFLGRTTRHIILTEGIETRVKRIIDERADCRKQKNWARADEIRVKLAELGVILEDTDTGTEPQYKMFPNENTLENLMIEMGITPKTPYL
ncbi:MAG: cysteine--tRNA ligase [Dehalococcoidales bacterium]|nr:cysteine--tRNA ligase [Dehalococcoidales bacterium]